MRTYSEHRTKEELMLDIAKDLLSLAVVSGFVFSLSLLAHVV
ncbi:hypothetical protein VQ042_02510 [Aurantimonas sp. A2-1-M11]